MGVRGGSLGRAVRLCVWVGLALVAFFALASPAHATFPGQNGKIIFTVSLGDGYSEFDLMNPDGTGKTRLTDHLGQITSPAWSADGKKIAFETDRYRGSDIAAMNADGTGLTRLTSEGINNDPA